MGVVLNDANSLQTFLMDISHINYTEEECVYILENQLLNDWLI